MSEDGCVCQDQHRRGYCTETGCPYAVAPAQDENAWRKPMQSVVWWLEGCLNCKTWSWDGLQREAAEDALKEAQAALAGARTLAAAELPQNAGVWTYKVHPNCCIIFKDGAEVARTENAVSADFIVEQCNAATCLTPAEGSELSRAQLEHIVGAHEQTIEQLRAELSAYAGQNTNLRNDLVQMGMARDQALSQVESASTKLADAYAALRSIAEGNLGSASWQANYETIKQVARNALSHSSTVSPSDPDAGLPTYQDVRGILKQPSKGEHADYVHGRLYAYDATSQTFDEAPGKFEGDRVTILQSDFEGLMADRRELKQLRTQAGHNRPRWRHVRRGGSYTEICRAELQASRDVVEGLTMVVYRGDDGKCWVRHEDEFEDGRFEQIGPAHSSTERQDG